MSIIDIINEFEITSSEGFQLTKRNGILTSTWLIYKEGEFYYYFDINQEIEYVDEYKYTKEELMHYFKDAVFRIDDIIS